MAKAGVDIHASKGTIEEIGLHGHHRANIVQHGVKFNIGMGWEAVPFNLVHDCLEPMGFFIKNKGESVTFITDTAYCEYVLPPCNVLLVEANFSEEILQRNVEAGLIDPARAKRVRENHFSIEKVLDFLKANDLSRCREVILIHGSDGNSDSALFKKMVQECTGILTTVAGE